MYNRSRYLERKKLLLYIITKSQEKIVEKIKKTNLERYGVEFVSQTERAKDKVKKTNLEKYGVEYGLKNEAIKEKSKQTWLKKIWSR